MERIGIIDIGSNSIRYMEAECTSSNVHSCFKSLQTTRLAEGQDQQRNLQAEPMRRSAEAVLSFAREAQKRAIPVYAYATSAVREARNQAEFLSLLRGDCPVAVLSGEQEGELAYLGATGGNGSLLDIGGGSMQIVLSESCSYSAPIGCVRFKDRIGAAPVELLRKEISSWMEPYFGEVSSVRTPVTGVGGTITTIGALLLGQTAYKGSELKNARITPASLNALIHTLEDMGETRKEHPLLKRRHDVILHGIVLLEYLMKRFSIQELTPSDRDGMEGFAEAILQGKILVNRV